MGVLQHTSILSLSPSLFLFLIPRITHNSNRNTRYLTSTIAIRTFHPSTHPSLHPSHPPCLLTLTHPSLVSVSAASPPPPPPQIPRRPSGNLTLSGGVGGVGRSKSGQHSPSLICLCLQPHLSVRGCFCLWKRSSIPTLPAVRRGETDRV